MAKRRCTAKTKAGKRCSRHAVDDLTVCIAHAPEEVKGSKGFGGPQEGGGRPRQPRVVEAMRERIEADVEKLVQPYFDAIEAAVHTATYEGEVIPSEVADLGARIAAVEKLLDRVYGKPRQVQEITGDGGGPVPVSVDVDDPEVRRLAHQLLRRRVDAAK